MSDPQTPNLQADLQAGSNADELTPHISLNDAHVSFPVYNSTTRSIRHALYEKLGGKVVAHRNTVMVDALRGITLDIKNGERVGLVGHNGAGKTTLLRVLARVYPPTAGSAKIVGQISALTDLSLGMDLEATGKENILYRCVFMGMTMDEAKEAQPKIAEFSELEQFLDLPVRTYSRGMFMRLAFSISTNMVPDILILDELIGAGDASFREKAANRITKLLEDSRILVLSSHSIGIVKKNCDRVIWLEKGQVKDDGPAKRVLLDYQNHLKNR